MSTNELDELEALLQSVLSDPWGFGERLLQQMVTRWSADAGMAGVGAPVPGGAGAPVVPGTVVGPLGPALPDSAFLVAGALGACECYGQAEDCPVCAGAGVPGWRMPDRELFELFVMPAATRLFDDAGAMADGDGPFHDDGAAEARERTMS